MTLHELRKDQVLALLQPHVPGDDRMRRCVEALRADDRSSFTADTSPADVLRQNLEVKYRIARQRGKILDGDDDLLIALSDVGDVLVTSVFTDRGGQHFDVFLAVAPLRPLSAVIMTD